MTTFGGVCTQNLFTFWRCVYAKQSNSFSFHRISRGSPYFMIPNCDQTMSVVTKTFSITFASAYKNEMKHFVGKLSIFVLQNNIIPEPGLFCQLFLHKSLIIRTTFTFSYYLLKSRSVSPLFMLPQQYLSRLNRRLMTKFRFHLWFTSRLKFRLFN